MRQGRAAVESSTVEALAFLTVLPVGDRRGRPAPVSLVSFPLVGLLVGGIWVLLGWSGAQWWGAAVAAALVSLVDLFLTGGLHLDGVADLADGWASRRPPGPAREVMRDPRVGAVGAAVLITVVLLRYSLLGLAIAQAEGAGRWWWLVVPPVAGRSAMVWMLGRSRAPQPGDPPSLTSGLVGAGGLIVAVASVLALLLGLAGAGWRGLGAVEGGVVVAEVLLAWSQRRFGALAGDALGAAGMAAEIVALAVLTARF